MKKFLISLLLFIPLMAFCQAEEKQYYIYNIVSFEGDFSKQKFQVNYDNGVEVKRLKGEKGDKIKFKTPAGALMYFLSEGWEMYLNGATSQGAMVNGIGGSTSSPYWILRKPCTKDEFEKAVQDATVK